MGKALELITTVATAPGATLTTAVPVAGNSLTIRDGRGARLIAVMLTRQAGGSMRITSPLIHDSSVGVNVGGGGGNNFFIPEYQQELQSQDTLIVQATGSAVAGDIELSSVLVAYNDLPGINGRFITKAEMVRRARNMFSNTINITTTAVNGGYSGGVSVASNGDAFKANRDYALVGYDVRNSPCHVVRYVGPDWGNLGVGGPGVLANAKGEITTSWFSRLDMVPVMSSSNKLLTTIDVSVDENALDPIITTHWVELL